MKSFFHLNYFGASSFILTNDRYLHCKTVPFYIFATTCEGHYELEYDNGPPVVCEEGGGFFASPETPLKIRHYVKSNTNRMTVRYIHFVITDTIGQDPFLMRKISPVVSSEFVKKNSAKIDCLIAGEASEIALNAAAFSLIAELYALTTPDPLHKIGHEYIRTICRMIDSRPERAFRVKELQRMANSSKSKFFVDFKQETGITPAEYVRKSRIEQSMRLLLSDQEMSIKEVSECGGWKNVFHFSREFKKHTGKSPREYRIEHQYPEVEQCTIHRNRFHEQRAKTKT